MRISDLTENLVESYSLNSSRIEHPEDLVLEAAGSGAIQAVRALEYAVSNPDSITFKPDGKPAIIWGKDENGFTMGDKYMFKKQTMPRSVTEIDAILLSRRGGGREDLIDMYKRLWPIFEQSLKPEFKGFVMGDLMWNKTPTIVKSNYEFKPNTVTYTVEVNSELGQEISKSIAGIVAHSYFSSIGGTGSHILDFNQLNTNGKLLIISDHFTSSPNIVRPIKLTQLEDFVLQQRPLINAFFQSGIQDLGGILKRYVNFRVRSLSYSGFTKEFLPWLDTTETGAFKKLSIKKWIKSHAKEFDAVANVFLGITTVKNEIIAQLDKLPTELHPSVNGVPGHEGYIVSSNTQPIKLVNRFHFSSANFKENP
jgi:hypothetical protein